MGQADELSERGRRGQGDDAHGLPRHAHPARRSRATAAAQSPRR
jgi:hypothetical protein